MSPSQAGRWAAVALMAYLTWQFGQTPLDGDVNDSFLHLPNLVFHEAGHVLFLPFGEFMRVLGGSLFQIIVPVVCAVSFGRQPNWFACAVCVWWAGQNLTDVAPYIADARNLQLPLIGGQTGAEVEGHDWEYLLTALGMLHRDAALGTLSHAAGMLVMVAAVIWTVVAARREGDPATPVAERAARAERTEKINAENAEKAVLSRSPR